MIVCLLGQTAVGKSRLSLKLAQELKTDIISADSMQIYKGFDIGTAKPSKEERRSTIHHMIDIVDPEDYFSSGDYAEQVIALINKLSSEDKIPFLSGGTGFYFDSVIYPNDFDNSIDMAYRELLKDIFNKNGKNALYDMLKEIDGASAKEIHPNNVKQVMRALEIYHTTGIKKSEGSKVRKARFDDYIIFRLTMPRETLYARIEKRVDEMLEKGLLDEAHHLFKTVNIQAQSMQGIGYKELVSYFKGDCDFNTAVLKIKQNTRNYAKKQDTYFRRMKTITLDAEKDDDYNIKYILSYINSARCQH